MNLLVHLSKHKDLIEVVLAGGGGIGAMMTNLEQGLRIAIGIVTLTYLLYKFRSFHVDRQNKIKKEEKI